MCENKVIAEEKKGRRKEEGKEEIGRKRTRKLKGNVRNYLYGCKRKIEENRTKKRQREERRE